MAESAAPDVLLGIERREHDGLVMDAGGMLVDGRGSLGAEVAVAGVEVECADVVSAVGAGELHAALDASDGVEAFHKFECSPFAAEWKARWWGSEGNGRVGKWGVSKWEWGLSYGTSKSKSPPSQKARRVKHPSPSVTDYFSRRLYFFNTSRRRS